MRYDGGMTNKAVNPNWIPDTATFGARLALIRWRMGWNLKEAAVECNLTQNSWGNWEDGVMPRNYIAVVNRIVLRTQVNKIWLMTGEGSPENGSVGPAGLDPTTSTVESRRFAGELIPFPARLQSA